MKKYLNSCIVALGLTGYFSYLSVHASETFTDEAGLVYELNEELKIAAIVGTTWPKNSTVANVYIPDAVNVDGTSYRLVSIADMTFHTHTLHEIHYQTTPYDFSHTMHLITLRLALPTDTYVIQPYAFTGCKNIFTVECGEHLATVGAFAFHDSEISKIRLPETVSYIGVGAFSNCTNLRWLVCNAPVPPEATDESFDFTQPEGHELLIPTDFNSCTLFVPAESIEAYRNAPGWRKFRNIQDLRLENEYDN